MGARSSLAVSLLACATGAAAAPAPCPSPEFKKFIAAFAGDANVQRAHTLTPLRYRHVDLHAAARPKVVEEMIKAPPRVYFELMARPKTAEHDLTSRIGPQRRGHAQLDLYEALTDRLISYHFRQADGCWKLEKISDSGM